MKRKLNEAPYSVRQGDVLLVDAAYRGGIPKDAKEVPKENGRVVLAHGEVTGHAHAFAPELAAKVKYYDAAAERYLCMLADAPLSHEEHTSVAFVRGRELQQAFQVEEQGEEVRRVAD